MGDCTMNNDMKLQLLDKQNELLRQENEKLKADLDYVSMMVDVPIPTEEDDDNE